MSYSHIHKPDLPVTHSSPIRQSCRFAAHYLDDFFYALTKSFIVEHAYVSKIAFFSDPNIYSPMCN